MNYAQNIITHAFHFIALVATICLPIVVRALVAHVNAKTSAHVTDVEEERILAVLSNALDYAEEQARKHALDAAAKMPSSDKLDHAVDFVFMEANRLGLEQLQQSSASRIHDMLEARLSYRRSMDDTPAAALAARTSTPSPLPPAT